MQELTPLLCREMFCAIPPSLFLEKILCLTLIMGDSCDSGQDPGFDEKGK